MAMGVLGYLERLGLSIEVLSDALCLEEHEILFSTCPSGGGAEGDAGLDLVLLTDERGFRRRAESFSLERRARGQRRFVGVIYEHVAGMDLHVEVQLLSTYESVLAALEALEPYGAVIAGEAERPAEATLGDLPREAAVDLLFQLGAGHAVVNGAAFEALRARLDLRKLRAWNVHQALLRSRDAIVDAERSLGRSDAENAYLKLSAAYDALGDAVLFTRGEGAERWRQRLPRLRALGPVPFVERYMDVLLVRRGPSEPMCAFVARQIDAAQGVVETVRGDASAALGCA